jgi:hypothetical protein
MFSGSFVDVFVILGGFWQNEMKMTLMGIVCQLLYLSE